MEKYGSTKKGGRLLPLTFFLLLFFIPSVSAASFVPMDIKSNVFIFLTTGALILFFLGIFANSVLMSSISIVLLILSGFLVMNGNVLYDSGVKEVVYKYGNNFTGYHWDYDAGTAPDGPQLDAYLFHKNESIVYEAWDDGNNVFIGFLVVVLGCILIFTIPAGMLGRDE